MLSLKAIKYAVPTVTFVLAAFSAQANEVVKIGVAGPLTGAEAHLGKDVENGARLAIEDLNHQGVVIAGTKVTFELVSEDDQGDPKTAVQVAQRLVDEGVKGVVGHLSSGPTIAASRIYASAGIPQVATAATNPLYTSQGFPTTFRLMANDHQQGATLGAFAQKLAGKGVVAIVDDRTAYGQGLADEVAKYLDVHHVPVADREYTNEQAVEFSSILTKIKGASPTVIVYGGADAQAGPMVRRMKTLGINAAFIGGDAVCTGNWDTLSSGAAEGQYCTEAGAPHSAMPKYGEFQDRFQKAYGKIVAFAPYSYDAVMILAKAMQDANSTDPKVYLHALAKEKYDGITGHIQFTPTGDNANGTVVVYKMVKGELTPVTQ
ncbi:branched-chain amino acid ABC transporter substrate-binding protein [Paraburkholderia sp. EG287B]|uniref:branched-chain amino acid ABC transporter substrate-binding protein n=1 Tax=unclassified Paraburkholderia TaxID=2615204 RepID=UPI0034D2ED50